MTRKELERWLTDNDIRCVRLQSVNHDGLPLGKHVSLDGLMSAVDKGSVVSDVAFGIDFGTDVAVGWDWGTWRSGDIADIKLIPDPQTITIDPCVEGWATVMCDFASIAGEPLPVCPRSAVKRMVAKLATLGYAATTAVEIEFTAFEESIQDARSCGYEGLTPLGGSSGVTYTVGRSPDLTELMDAVLRRLDRLAIPWEGWSNETAAGQAEINIAPSDPLTTADRVMRAKLALREAAFDLGRSVTFMSRVSEDQFGAGMHINVSLANEDGEPAFFDASEPGNRSAAMRHWIAGQLAVLPGSVSLLSPNMNSYRRFVDLTGPPTTVTWAEDNKTVALRTVTREPHTARVEHRVAGADCNVYYALAAALAGGIAGLSEKLEPPAEFAKMAWGLPESAAPRLPTTLTAAAEALLADERLATTLGRELIKYWAGSRRWEWWAFTNNGGDPDTVNEFERRRYFEHV